MSDTTQKLEPRQQQSQVTKEQSRSKISSPRNEPKSHQVSVEEILKPVGPGQYELPKLTGARQNLSNRINQPSFSLSSRTDQNNKLVISKQHKVEMLGKDSPGVGRYQYDYTKLSKSVLSDNGQGGNDFSFGQQKKFFDFQLNLKLKGEVPHSYNVEAKAKWLKEVGGFPKDSRFKYEKEDQIRAERSPGPITATHIDISLPKIGYSKRQMNATFVDDKNSPIKEKDHSITHRNRFDDSKKIYFKELEREIQGKDSPGFIYESNYQVSREKRSSFSFSKSKRDLNVNKNSKAVPPPGQYETINLTQIKNQTTGGSFGKATRNVDFVSLSDKHKLYAGQKFL